MNRAGWVYFRAFLVTSALYFISGWLNSTEFQQARIIDISTGFDRRFFVPEAVWAYSLYYVLLVYPILGRQTYEQSVRLSWHLIGFSILGFILFLTLPVKTLRPGPEHWGNGISSYLLNLIYSFDQPYNCFPSMHVLQSWLIAIFFQKVQGESLAVRGLLLVSAFAVTFSTVLIRQHYVLDVVVSLIMVAIWTLLQSDWRSRYSPALREYNLRFSFSTRVRGLLRGVWKLNRKLQN